MKKILLISLAQALSLSLYISLISLVFLNAPFLFGNSPNYLGPFLFLTLFVISALICGFIVFWQPFLYWQKKKTSDAIRLVVYTASWLIVFFLILLLVKLNW